jgi:sterol desaturase/sphingolipid hydroxylase (fatty acid hydroxylase superfamily)
MQGIAEAMRSLLAPLRETHVVDVYLSPLLWLPLVAAMALEYLRPARAGQKVLSAGLFQDAVWVAVSAVFRLAVMGFYVAMLRWIYDRHMSFLTIHAVMDWPMWARVLLAILVGDFLGWFHHLVRHKVPALWAFHAVHHSQREMNVLTDVRVHPLDRIASQTVQFVPLFMVDAAFPEIAAWVLFHQAWTKFCHANVRMNCGWLGWILVTPQSHRVHHSVALEHRDTNFGVALSIWDRLFGTRYAGVDEYPECGVDDPTFPMETARTPSALVRSTWAQLVWPFRQLGRSRAPEPVPSR